MTILVGDDKMCGAVKNSSSPDRVSILYTVLCQAENIRFQSVPCPAKKLSPVNPDMSTAHSTCASSYQEKLLHNLLYNYKIKKVG